MYCDFPQCGHFQLNSASFVASSIFNNKRIDWDAKL